MTLPYWRASTGWSGGESRTLYAFVDRRTGRVMVRPAFDARGIGDECDVRVATDAERVAADYPEGWIVNG